MIVSMLFMAVLMFIGIWGFVIYIKSYKQTRYQNYILEKIYQKLVPKHDYNSSDKKLDYLTGEEFDLNSIFNQENFSEKYEDFKDMHKDILEKNSRNSNQEISEQTARD